MNHTHEIIIRIYYHDTEASGEVHHANYLSFAERGRMEFLRNSFGDFTSAMRERGLNIVARHLELTCHSPSHLDDELRIVTYSRQFGNSSFVMQSDMFLEDKPIAEVRMTGVFVNDQFKPTRIPDDMKEKLL